MARTITNETGVRYTFGLPAYSYGEEVYQEKIDRSNGLSFNRQKKNTPYAAQMAAADAAKVALDAGLKRVEVFVKGPGSGREGAIRSISQSGIEVISIKDVTPLPHNGCRPPKQRRV